jgi:hypothetical protein
MAGRLAFAPQAKDRLVGHGTDKGTHHDFFVAHCCGPLALRFVFIACHSCTIGAAIRRAPGGLLTRKAITLHEVLLDDHREPEAISHPLDVKSKVHLQIDRVQLAITAAREVETKPRTLALLMVLSKQGRK